MCTVSLARSEYFRTSARAAVIMMRTLLYDLMHRLEVVFTNPDGTLTIGTGAKEYAQSICSVPQAELYLDRKSLSNTLQSPILFSCDPFPVQGTLHITGPDRCHLCRERCTLQGLTRATVHCPTMARQKWSSNAGTGKRSLR